MDSTIINTRDRLNSMNSVNDSKARSSTSLKNGTSLTDQPTNEETNEKN